MMGMDTKLLKQKILDLAIRGKLVPQDPNDEPASVLLERIRTEREKLIAEGKLKRSKNTSDNRQYENVPFEVPKSWEWCKVEDFSFGLQYGTSEKSLHEGLVPVLRMGNITCHGTIDYSDLVYSSNEDDIDKYSLQYNDLLFNRTNSSEWVGKTAIYKAEKPALYAGYLIRIRTFVVYPDFINFVMNSSYHRDWCNQVKTDAVNQSNINAQKLSKLQIPLPPLSEQERIVAEIDRWFALIDELEKDKNDLQDAIKQTKNKILDLAIHGKLVEQDPNDESASDLLKRIAPNATPCDNSHYPNIPESWCVCTFKDVFDIAMGSSPSGNSLNKNKVGVEFHQGKINFSDVYLKESDIYTQMPTKFAEAQSLLLCVRAPVGMVNITERKICIGRGLCCLKPKEGIDFMFAFYALQTHKDHFEEQASGSTFNAISGDTIRNELFILPPYMMQIRIRKKLENVLQQINTIITIL